MNPAAHWSALLLLAVCAACGGDRAVAVPEVALDDLERPLANLLRERSRAVRSAPASADAWGALAMAFDAHGFADEALECYRRAAELDPRDFRWPYLAGVLVGTSDQAGALEHFARAAALRDDYAPLYVRSGKGRYLVGDLAGARADLQRALELDGGLVSARLGLARVELGEDRPVQALEQLDAARRAAPVSDEIHSLAAEVFRRHGDDTAAAEAAARVGDGGRLEPLPDPLRGAVEEQGVSLVWVRRRADRALELGNPLRAVELWRAAVELDERNAEARLALARLLRQVGRGPEGERHLTAAASLLADAQGARDLELRAQAALHLGVLALERDDLPEAERRFMAARECDETHAAGEANLGAVYLRMGRISEALELLNRAAEALPGDPGVRVNLGNALADGGLWAQAHEAFDAALAIDPEHCPARFQRGRVRAEMLDFVGAAEDFESVTRLEPENAVAYRNLARARGRAGDHAAAIAALRRGLERLPRDARLCQQLAWSLATSPDASVRDGQEALRLARELVAQRPDDPELSEVLAAASAEVGDFAAALRYEGAALAQLDDLRPEPPALEVLREKMLVRLETYRAG